MPYCRRFEEVSGELFVREISAGAVAVECQMRHILGVESERTDNALALTAESGRFDELRRQVFAHQPAENARGFTSSDLIELGQRAGLTGPDDERGVREGRYRQWSSKPRERSHTKTRKELRRCSSTPGQSISTFSTTPRRLELEFEDRAAPRNV